jgi:hypothetical protein
MRREWRLLNAVTDVRKTAADVVTLCDLIIYGNQGQVRIAQRRLPARLRQLSVRAQRTLAALAREGPHE